MGTKVKKLRRTFKREGKQMNTQQKQAPELPAVDLSKIPDKRCLGCKSEFWVQAFKLKIVSPFISPTKKEQIFHAPGWICAICGLELNKKPLIDE